MTDLSDMDHHHRSSESPLYEMLLDQEIIISATKKQKRKRWKKPADHPKRPLSAYNLFFQWGRERLLSGQSLAPLKQEDVDQIDVDTRRNSKRRHRREHGVIGFTELAKMLGAKWKELDPEYKEMFQKRAGVEKTRYEKAVSLYKASLVDEKQSEKVEATGLTQPQKLQQNKKKANKLFPQSPKRNGKPKLNLREDVEAVQPFKYDAVRPGVPFSLAENQVRTSNVYPSWGDPPVYYYEQAASENQTMQTIKSHDTNLRYMPPAMNRGNYNTVPSNSAAASYNDSSMGPATGMPYNTMWAPNMPAASNSFLPNQAYPNYFDPPKMPNMSYPGGTRYWPTDVPHPYAMPQFGDTAVGNHPPPMMQPSNMYNQYHPQYPRQAEPLAGPTPTTTHYAGMRDDVDGLSTTSPLHFFE